MNNCSHVCLMTFETEEGYTCACPDGHALEPDGFECKRKQFTSEYHT